MGWYRRPKLLKWVGVLDSTTADFVQTGDVGTVFAYIMETFPIVKRKDEQKYGTYRTRETISETYDKMAEVIRANSESGVGNRGKEKSATGDSLLATPRQYQTHLNPPPADPRVAHPPRRGRR